MSPQVAHWVPFRFHRVIIEIFVIVSVAWPSTDLYCCNTTNASKFDMLLSYAIVFYALLCLVCCYFAFVTSCVIFDLFYYHRASIRLAILACVGLTCHHNNVSETTTSRPDYCAADHNPYVKPYWDKSFFVYAYIHYGNAPLFTPHLTTLHNIPLHQMRVECCQDDEIATLVWVYLVDVQCERYVNLWWSPTQRAVFLCNIIQNAHKRRWCDNWCCLASRMSALP